MDPELPREAKAVIVGGGIIGCSVAYHLARLGWRDVVLLEQGRLAGGTTWHAAGLVGRLRTSTGMTAINKYSAELYAGLERETGQPTGWKRVGSLIVGRSAERMTQLRRTAAMAERFGVDVRLIGPEAAREKWPLLRVDDVLGAAWLPDDGKVVPEQLTLALAKGARDRGATVLENVRVLEVEHQGGRATGVRTERGPIRAEYVVLCGGMWSRQLALRCGVSLPLHPVEHHYAVTDPVAGASDDLPVGRDPDLCIYFRGEGQGLVLGAFQEASIPWAVDRVPDDFSFKLLEPDWGRFAEPLRAGRWRIPALEQATFARFVNGPESFTPDNNFLLGETPELRRLFVACGFNSLGIASAGGAGKYLAEWMAEGQPTMDLWAVDVRRFGPWANNRAFLRERSAEVLGLHYQMAWPNREFSTGRGLRRSPLHDRLAARGACFGVKGGWERPNWFWFARGAEGLSHKGGPGREGEAPAEPDEPRSPTVASGADVPAGSAGASPSPPGKASQPVTAYSFGRQNWFDDHAAEHQAARERVAVFDQSGFAKFLVRGRDAAGVLQRLCANDVDVPVGKAVYTAMLNERGGFESDLTAVRLADDEFYLISGTAQAVRDADWVRRHIGAGEHVELVDVTEAYAVLGVMGPSARTLLGRLCDTDLSDEAFPFGTARTIGVGRATARAIRLTYVGELGWELHVPTSQAAALYDALTREGGGLGLSDAGHYALNSLRLEKGYRAWGAELTPDDTPLEAGLGFAVAWDKPFLGREALLRQKAAGVKRRLVLFVLEDPGPVLWGGEPIYRDGHAVGHTTSGSYGHTVGGGVALGYVADEGGVDARFVRAGRYEINVSGQRYPATAHLRSAYDPGRQRIRS